MCWVLSIPLDIHRHDGSEYVRVVGYVGMPYLRSRYFLDTAREIDSGGVNLVVASACELIYDDVDVVAYHP